jgi:predicted DNA-binding transcriptional regulator AlpA
VSLAANYSVRHLTEGDVLSDTYLTEEEFSNRFHVSGRTAQRWRVTGDGPKWVRIGLRRVAYRLSDCEEWAAERTFQHRAAEMAQASKREAA